MSAYDLTAGHTTSRPRTPTRDRIAKTLMLLLALSTVGAFANGVLAFPAVPPEQMIVELWRTLAYLVFAGLFTLLALFPRRMPGVWELVFFQKAAVALLLAFVIKAGHGAAGTDTPMTIIAVDGTLAAVTLVSYVLARGWRSWGRP